MRTPAPLPVRAPRSILASLRRRSPAPALVVVSLLALLAAAAPALAAPASMTLEERLSCQEAIERVYHRHRTGDTRPFAEAVPGRVLERKVLLALGQSAALERFWATPVTGDMLHAELRRIAASTLLPERLSQIYDALENDPLLLQECLARPVLVDRLSRSFFAADERIHAAARQEAERIRAALAAGELDPWADHPSRAVVEIERREPDRGASLAGASPGRMLLDATEFAVERGRAPREVGAVGELSQDRHSFSIRVVLDEEDGWARLAVYSVPKVTWEEWWSGVEGTLDVPSARSVPAPAGEPPAPGGRRLDAADPLGEIWTAGMESSAATCDPVDSWDNKGLDDVPAGRLGHTAVWTGTRMIVWGGAGPSSVTDRGGLYDPLTDTWLGMSRSGAPSGRQSHTAVWTGDRMIVWGGTSGGASLDTGGLYDPVTDTWESTSTVGAPPGRGGHTAVWTGTEMIVWGGNRLSTGGRYDPATDTWAPTSLVGAPAGRSSHTAVWSGSRMVVWGGTGGGDQATGGRYDPSTDTWEPTTLTGAPTARRQQTAVWTGSEMIVWGGVRRTSFLCSTDAGGFIEIFHDEALGEGAAYDPVQDAWRALPAGPAARFKHTAVWDGQRMIVTGGVFLDIIEVSSSCDYAFPEMGLLGGGMIEPQSGAWTFTSTVNAPFILEATAVWSGDLKLIWGSTSLASFASGARFDPDANAWTPINAGDAPVPRSGPTAVWTGNEMIVWGGNRLSTGGRYDPVLDAWTPTSDVGAPEGREEHSAVWTGQEMIVWGGRGLSSSFLPTGGRYDPLLDSWTATSLGASGKRAHTAVWTGQEMIVWGGVSQTGCCDGRYDPSTDSWASVSMTGAPSQRSGHTAVWTGSEMLVWGGSDPLGAGGRYEPVTDTWSPISTVGEPAARTDHTALWTGARMIVWGGEATADPVVTLDTGGLYDPATDTWAPTATTGAPSPRLFHTAVWTGVRMIVWGGSNARTGGSELETGGRFDLAGGSWSPTALVDAPLARRGHGAVTAGAEMIVWGGAFGGERLRDGGRYLFLEPGDPCSAGFGACETTGTVICPGDGSGAVCDAVPGDPAPEVCDGIDNDCNRIVDDGDPGGGDSCGVSDVGECQLGVTTCSGGAVICSGNVDPVMEFCGDGLDNDCDGAVDELTPTAVCTLLPSTLNVNSQAGSFQVGLTDLVDSCDPSNPVPLDASSISIAWISRAGDTALADPFSQACPDPVLGTLFERGIVENLAGRQVTGQEVRLKFNLDADGDCQTLDGGRQELIGLLSAVADGTQVPVCVTSSFGGSAFECCGSAVVKNSGNR